MQIASVSQQNFRNNHEQKNSSSSKALRLSLPSLGAGIVTGGVGYKLGQTHGAKFPMDEVLLSKERTTQSRITQLTQEDSILKASLEKLKTKLLEVVPKFNQVSQEVGKKVYPILHEKIEFPLECDCFPHNSHMVRDKSRTLCENIIERFKSTLVRNIPEKLEIVTITKEGDILECMEQAKATYEKTKKFTVLHILNFDDLINKTKEFNDISGMKALLGDCADEYNTTVLFTSDCPEKLDKIALGDHRVHQIDLSPHVEDKHRLIIDEYEKITKDYTEQSERQLKQFLETLDLKSELREIRKNMTKYREDMMSKYSFRGLKLGALIGVVSAGLLGILLTRKNE